MVAAAALVTFAAPRARAQALGSCGPDDRSLRVMTWNVKVMPEKFYVPFGAGLIPIDPTQGTEDEYGLPDWQRASIKIPERIRRILPDVLVLNEHWEPDGPNTLFNALRLDYPYQIQQIRDDSRVSASGLAVLSRFPFFSFQTCINGLGTHVSGERPSGDIDTGDCLVNTYLYNPPGQPPLEVVDVDALASKMVAMVRVQPDWNENCFVNIAFTHMTASYGGDGDDWIKQEARENAAVAVENLITATLSPTQLQREPIIYLGDLNTDGNFGTDDDPDITSDNKPTPYWAPPAISQWERLFSQGTSTAMFACGAAAFDDSSCRYDPDTDLRVFTDAWGFEHPRTDHGVSFACDSHSVCDDINGERLDYIFHNHPVDPAGHQYLCMQHAQRLYPDHQDLGCCPNPQSQECGWCGITNIAHFDGGKAYSDHVAVFADFGFNQVQMGSCNPVERDATSPQAGPSYGSEPVVWGTGPNGTPACKGWPLEPGESWCPSTNSSCQDRTFPITLLFPRHYFWFKIPEDNDGDCAPGEGKDKGTFSIGADLGVFHQLDIRVYQARDLSWQLPPAHADEVVVKDGFKLKVYHLPDPPYYVRVNAPNMADETDLPVNMIFRKNTCTDPHDDYCILTPGIDNALTVGWPGPAKWVYAWDFTPDPSDHTDLNTAECGTLGVTNNQSPFHFDYMYFRFWVDAPGGANTNIDFYISTTDETSFNLKSIDPGKGIRIFDASDLNPEENAPFNVKHCDYGDASSGCSSTQCTSNPGACNVPISLPAPTGTNGNVTLLTGNETTGVLSPIPEASCPPTRNCRPRPFIMRVHRSEGEVQMADMRVEMHSELTWVKTELLEAKVTNDWPHSEDDIRVFIRTGTPSSPPAQPSCTSMPSPEFAQEMHAKETLTGFAGEEYALTTLGSLFSMRLCEEDWNTDSEWYWGVQNSLPSDFEIGYLADADPNEPTPGYFWYCPTGGPDCADSAWYYFLQISRQKELMGAPDDDDPVPASCP